jgi:hypothetical protein
MKTPIAPIRLWAGIALIALQILLSSCSSTKQIEWKEEVLLQTGEAIIVKRVIQMQEDFELSQGRNWVPREQKLNIKHPLLNNGQEAIWALDAVPIILDYDIQRKQFFIVATIALCEQDRALGRPRPPYLLFEFSGGEWRQVELRPVLEGKTANLLITNYLKVDGRTVIEKQKREIHESTPGLSPGRLKVLLQYPITC